MSEKPDNLAKLLKFIYERDRIEQNISILRATILLNEMKEFIDKFAKGKE